MRQAEERKRRDAMLYPKKKEEMLKKE